MVEISQPACSSARVRFSEKDKNLWAGEQKWRLWKAALLGIFECAQYK